MSKGMTLIELVVTIGIISLLLVAGIPSYNHFTNVNNLNQAVDDVKSAILDTQNFAMSPQSDKETQYDSYSIIISDDSSDNKYNIYQYKSEDGSKNNPPVKEFSLPSGIIFEGYNSIKFSISKQGKIDETCDSKIITIKSSKLNPPNDTKSITINCITAQMVVTTTP